MPPTTSTNLNEELIKAYGTQIEEDIETIKIKISAVIAAHLFAGTTGDNFLCQLNIILNEIIETS